MSMSELAAVLVFILYALLEQWTFRCQRVSRGILLLARDTAAGLPDLHASLTPGRMILLMWLKWLSWLVCGVCTWRAWGWWGIGILLLYSFLVGALVDIVSPWPSYARLLRLHDDHVLSGQAGAEAVTLRPWILHLLKQVRAGVPFEKATTGVWMNRAVEAARADTHDPSDRTPG